MRKRKIRKKKGRMKRNKMRDPLFITVLRQISLLEFAGCSAGTKDVSHHSLAKEGPSK